MQTLMDRWLKVIEQDAEYGHVLAKTKPGQKKRQVRLAEVIDPYEAKVMKDIEDQDLGKSALIDFFVSEELAYKRANEFGSDFILGVEIPGFEHLSEIEQEAKRYQYAIKGIVWEALMRRLMVPELHVA